MDYTANYQLPVWAETDRILRTDFNDAFAAIETALSGHDGDLTEKGNCRIETGSYIGTGASTMTLTFPAKPLLILIWHDTTSPRIAVLQQDRLRGFSFGVAHGVEQPLNATPFLTSWSGNSVTTTIIYGDSQGAMMNQASVTYSYMALSAADET